MVDDRQHTGHGHRRQINGKNDRKNNQHLYLQISHNDSEWDMQKYKKCPCNSKAELLREEQKVIDELDPNMNEMRAVKKELRMQQRTRFFVIEMVTIN